MLSISARGSAASAEKYYDHLNDEHGRGPREDYYANSRDQPGEWFGAGAAALGLTGAVSRAAFGNALRGRDASGRDLVQGAGAGHRAGWDLTFSAPKSVSVAWAVGDGQQRAAIQVAHDRAVRAALQHVQDHALVARRGRGGAEREPAAMVASIFAHGTSREQDPQLHSHAFVHNLAQRQDGTWGGIESRDLYQWKMAAGAVYRAEMAAQMQALGFAVERDRDSFRLAAVPRAAEQAFRTRRQQIEQALAERGASGARASEVAALDSRRAKQHASPDALLADWQARGRACGFGPEQAAAARQPAPVRGESVSRADLLRALTENQSTFQERDIYRVVATAAQGSGTGAAGVRDTVAELMRDRELVRLTHRETGETRWTTREMQVIERRMLDTSTRLDARQVHTLDRARVDAALARFAAENGFALSDEQAEAVRHLCQGNDLALVQGGAGTGKSTMAAARLAWESQGLTVRGAAISGKAAAGLQDGSGIRSQTVASLLQGIQSGRDALDSKTVLIIDEAGMLGSRQTAQLLAAADRAGAKIVLIGDSRQLQAVDAGGAFRALQQQHGAAMLDEIRRQRDRGMRQAVEHLSRGEVRGAMRVFLDRGTIHVADDRDGAMRQAVNQWAGKYDRARPGETLILANTRAEVAALNALAREWMQANHQLGPSAEIQTTNREGNPAGRLVVAEGDRIRFGLNNGRIGVRNGELGTLARVEMDAHGQIWLSVKTDRGETVRFSPNARDDKQRYACLSHGYAVTTHSAQGATVDYAVVLAGGSMQSLESTYVQMSRMRYSTEIITTRQGIADQAAAAGIDLPLDEDRDPLDDLRELIEQMERSDQKGTTLEYEYAGPDEPDPAANGLDLAAALTERDQAAGTVLAEITGAPPAAPSPAEVAAGPELE